MPKLTVNCHILLKSFFFPFFLNSFFPFPGQTQVWKSVNEFHKYYSLYFHKQLKSGGIRFHSSVRRLAQLQSTSEISITLFWRDNSLSMAKAETVLPFESWFWHIQSLLLQQSNTNMSAMSRPYAKAEFTCKAWSKSESIWDLKIFKGILGLSQLKNGLDSNPILASMC